MRRGGPAARRHSTALDGTLRHAGGTGLENCARGLRQIAPHAERKDTGFLAQEFVPTDEPLRALTEAFRICDV